MASIWDTVVEAPPDAILGLNTAFRADTHPSKVNLGVGAYRTEDGEPYVLPVVRRKEQELAHDRAANHEYVPQDGIPAFFTRSAEVIFGKDSPALAEGRVTSVQALSGTGALRVGLTFVHAFLAPDSLVYLPNPTWSNHKNIVPNTGLPPARDYRYYDSRTRAVNIEGMLADLQAAPERSIVLLHACCHNPTGSDLRPEQWRRVLDVVQENNLLPFFDCAYQGFGSGSLDEDAAAVRLFAEAGVEMLVACSFAKNMGLYGERVGALHVLCKSAAPSAPVRSQLKKIIRAMYSSPPVHGARVAALILNDPEAFKEWEGELGIMTSRIKEMRKLLKAALEKLETPGNWDHIVTQIGMFSYTGISPRQVAYMRDKYHIYMTSNGRISMAGLTTKNVDYVAQAMYDAVMNVKDQANL